PLKCATPSKVPCPDANLARSCRDCNLRCRYAAPGRPDRGIPTPQQSLAKLASILADLHRGGNPGRRSIHHVDDPGSSLPGGRLDPLHVGVRQTEMMADLMHQHVRDEMPQRLLAFRPAVKQRAAVEEHHVGAARQVHHALLLKADTLVKPHQVERALELELTEHLLAAKILHPHTHV